MNADSITNELKTSVTRKAFAVLDELLESAKQEARRSGYEEGYIEGYNAARMSQ